jgi:demethylmenaquinone methyltransferase/2-methoxy-6-polyprenyl-1,4-benzoquinol methylase
MRQMAKPNPGQPNQMAIRARYDSVARWHDDAGLFLMPHRRDAILALNVQPGECVLDLACGTGINFKGVMTELGADGLLVGLDYSPGMLKQAHQRVKRYHWSNVALFLSDAARLPFADSVFGRVICTYSLKVIPPYRQALDEVVRVLKPGGVFVVLDGKLSNGVTRFLNPLAQWMARGAMSDVARPLVDEIVQRFQNVRISEYTFGHTFVAVARKG